MNAAIGMPLVGTLETLLKLRGDDDIVITTMSAAREAPKLSQHPLDLHYIPSTMGGGPALGLGLALAQPQREVLVLSGDGSLLMNLGSLVTIVSSGATNLTLAVLDGLRMGYSLTPMYSILFHLKAVGGELTPHPLECAAVGWFGADELPWPTIGASRWGPYAFAAIRGERVDALFDPPRDPIWRGAHET